MRIKGYSAAGMAAVVCALVGLLTAPAYAGNPLGRYAEEAQVLPPELAFRSSLMSGRNGEIMIRWEMPPGFYLYRNKMKIEGANGMSIRRVTVPSGLRVDDPFLGQVEIYRDSVTVIVERDRAVAGTLKVAFQGCEEDRICYPPMTRQFAIPASQCKAGARIEAGAC